MANVGDLSLCVSELSAVCKMSLIYVYNEAPCPPFRVTIQKIGDVLQAGLRLVEGGNLLNAGDLPTPVVNQDGG